MRMRFVIGRGGDRRERTHLCRHRRRDRVLVNP